MSYINFMHALAAYKFGCLLLMLCTYMPGIFAQADNLVATADSGRAKHSSYTERRKGGMVIKTALPGIVSGNYALIMEYFLLKDLSIEAGIGITGKNNLFQSSNPKMIRKEFLINGRRTYPTGFSYQFGIKYFIPKKDVFFMLHYNNLKYHMEYPLEGNIPGLTGTQPETLDYQMLSFMIGYQPTAFKRFRFEFIAGPAYFISTVNLFEEQSYYNNSGEIVRKSGTYQTEDDFFSINLLIRFGYVLK